MKVHPLFAIDIGSTKVAFVVAERDDAGEVQILDAISVPNRGVQRGVVCDLEETAAAIANATRDARQYGEGLEVAVSIDGSHIEGMNSQGFMPISPINRAIQREDVLHVINHSRQVLPAPDREQIVALPREFRVNGQRGITRPIGMAGTRLEVITHIITGQISHVHNIERAVELAGFRVAEMVPAPFAAALGVATQQERELGCLVVDIGAGTTDVAIFSGGTLAWTACLPIGGGHVTSDLVMLLKTSPEEAERLKKEHGRAVVGNVKDDSTVEVHQIGQSESKFLQRRILYEIIESRMREIVQHVKLQMERSGHFGMLPGGVLLTGGSAHMPGLPQLFASVLSDPNVRVASPKAAGSAGVRFSSPEFAVAAGLAFNGLQSREDALEPVSGFGNWKERIMSMFQL